MEGGLLYPVETLPKWKLAYVAGIIDGEGCVTIIKYKKGGNLYYSPRIQVNMTHKACIQLMHSCTGVGNFTVYDPLHGKLVYYWQVGDRLEVYILLKALHPYLIVKKEQTNLLLEFVERRIQECPISTHDDALFEKIKTLNSGGT